MKRFLFLLLLVFTSSCAKDGKNNNSFSTNKVNIALMVPITGANSAMGNSIAKAAKMAIVDSKKNDINLDVIDTGSEPSISYSSITSVKSKNYKIIIGPLFSKHTMELSKAAPEIPIISFSNDRAVQRSGNTYLAGLMPEQQIIQIVKYASNKGYSDIYALLPKNKYGELVKKTIETGFDDANYNIKLIAYYDDKPSIEAAVQEILDKSVPKPFDLSDLSDAQHEKVAILIPEGGANLIEIMSYISKNRGEDIRNVRFIGTSQWSESDISSAAELNGSAWIAAPSHSSMKTFKQHYISMFEEEPYDISMLGYDITKLVVTLLNENVSTISTSIKNPSGFTGFSGTFKFMNNGENQRDLSIFEVKNGRLIEVNKEPIS